MADIIDETSVRLDSNCITFLKGFIPSLLNEVTDATPEPSLYEPALLPYIYNLIENNKDQFKRALISRNKTTEYIKEIESEEDVLNLMILYVKINHE